MRRFRAGDGRRPRRNKFRHNAIFVRDIAEHSTPMDRNARAKVLYVADALFRRTKPEGGREGVLSLSALAILKALLLRFHNQRTGRCDPSYEALMAVTGFCRQTIARGLAMLESCGLLRITRRIERAPVTRISAITGEPETYIGTVQRPSVYAFAMEPHPVPLPVVAGRVRQFPSRREALPAQISMLFEQPSLLSSQKPAQSVSKKAGLDWRSAARVLLAKGSAMK
jgi:hypothetical protein